MKKLLIAAGVAALAFSGCKQGAQYEDAGGNRTVVSLDKVNIQDFANAADFLVQSLLRSGAFAELSKSGTKPVIAISGVRNDTSGNFDTDQLTKKIRIAILNSGKAEISTTVAAGGRAEDALARELKQQDDFAAGRDTLPKVPQYTLSGKILEDRASAGDVKQTSYTFMLTLTRVGSGTSIWEEEKIITKQGEKDSVGW